MQSVSKVSYTIKPDFIQVVLAGQPYLLDSTHPSFKKVKSALEKKQWKRVPSLINLTQRLDEACQGSIEVTKGVVRYKGKAVKAAITDRIIAMHKKKKPIQHMLRFMDNLYQNPSQKATEEFFQWLEANELPITDDGCFLAYKSVDSQLRDEYTHTIDNSPGQIIMMSRKVADTDYGNQCSTGFHICSKHYGLYGSRVLAVKTNPKYVLSAQGGKIRVTQYEVLKELGLKSNQDFQNHGFADLEKKLVIEVKKERKEMLRMLFAIPSIQRKLKSKKLSKKSLIKTSYGRLAAMLKKQGLIDPISVGPDDSQFLQKSRKAAGLTLGQVAKQMQVNLKKVVDIEAKANPGPIETADYLDAVGNLSGNHNISFPNPVVR